MSDIWTDRQMQDLPPEGQARKAIAHTLRAIKDNWQAGYHLGVGTQTFALLTEAAVTLFGQSDLKKLREDFAPRSDKPADSELVTDIAALARDLKIDIHRDGCISEARKTEFIDAVLKKLAEGGKA